jgi:hypothetical protein
VYLRFFCISEPSVAALQTFCTWLATLPVRTSFLYVQTVSYVANLLYLPCCSTYPPATPATSHFFCIFFVTSSAIVTCIWIDIASSAHLLSLGAAGCVGSYFFPDWRLTSARPSFAFRIFNSGGATTTSNIHFLDKKSSYLNFNLSMR